MHAQLLSHVLLFVAPCDCSQPGSSAHGIFQARVLEWVAVSFSRGSSQLRDQTLISCVSYIGRWICFFFFFFFTTSATYKAHCSSHISSAQKRWSEQLRKVLAWPNQMWFWSLFYQWLLVVRCLVFHTYIQADRYTRRSVRLSGNQQLFLILLLFFKK